MIFGGVGIALVECVRENAVQLLNGVERSTWDRETTGPQVGSHHHRAAVAHDAEAGCMTPRDATVGGGHIALELAWWSVRDESRHVGSRRNTLRNRRPLSHLFVSRS